MSEVPQLPDAPRTAYLAIAEGSAMQCNSWSSLHFVSSSCRFSFYAFPPGGGHSGFGHDGEEGKAFGVCFSDYGKYHK
jgi:hypothetical protein